ncbi:MAG TPA: hypothetical protein VMT54_16660 [Candidatus Cybelea sp.]|nr:hypothetical protein [Candidatus Cybelea sp.]
MYNARPIVDPRQARMDSLRARLRLLDLRITRVRERHGRMTDALAKSLIHHSLGERAEVPAKLTAQ